MRNVLGSQPSAWVAGYVIVTLLYETFHKTMPAHAIITWIILSTGSASPRFFLEINLYRFYALVPTKLVNNVTLQKAVDL